MYHVVGTADDDHEQGGGRDGLLGRFYPVRLRPATVFRGQALYLRLLRELLLNIGKPPHTHTAAGVRTYVMAACPAKRL